MIVLPEEGAVRQALKAYLSTLRDQQEKLVDTTYTSSAVLLYLRIAMGFVMVMALSELILVLIRYCFNSRIPDTNHTLEVLKIAFCEQAYKVYNTKYNTSWLKRHYFNREVFQMHMFNRFYEKIVNEHKNTAQRTIEQNKPVASDKETTTTGVQTVNSGENGPKGSSKLLTSTGVTSSAKGENASTLGNNEQTIDLTAGKGKPDKPAASDNEITNANASTLVNNEQTKGSNAGNEKVNTNKQRNAVQTSEV